MVEAGDGDIGSLRWAIEPHGFVHATADFLFMFSAMPLAPRETLITSKWLVHKDAVEGVDYDLDAPDRAVEPHQPAGPRAGREQPARASIRRAITPGPYCADAEALTMRFTDWYCADRARLSGATAMAEHEDAHACTRTRSPSATAMIRPAAGARPSRRST